MSRLLALPRELRDEIYSHTFGPRGFNYIHHNDDGDETYRLTTILANPKGRLASLAPGLFLVNHQIHAEYMERCVKAESQGPAHTDIVYECRSLDQAPHWLSVPGEQHMPRTGTYTISISIGPHWGWRTRNRVERAFVQECEFFLKVLRFVLGERNWRCKALDLTMIVKPWEFSLDRMNLRSDHGLDGYRREGQLSFRCIYG